MHLILAFLFPVSLLLLALIELFIGWPAVKTWRFCLMYALVYFAVAALFGLWWPTSYTYGFPVLLFTVFISIMSAWYLERRLWRR